MEIARYRSVAGTDVVAEYSSEDLAHVFDLGEFGRAPVVE